jgi:hypothetical protein
MYVSSVALQLAGKGRESFRRQLLRAQVQQLGRTGLDVEAGGLECIPQGLPSLVESGLHHPLQGGI